MSQGLTDKSFRTTFGTLLMHLISFILPFTVIILIPCWIERNITIGNIWIFLTGLIITCFGLYLIYSTIFLFIKYGKGTLAPWSPTKNLVIYGMYRHVRNPMITGVLIVLTGESLAFLSRNIFIWAITFFIINNIYFVLYEEPDLFRKFGDAYEDYKKNVSRWIPKIKPYLPEQIQEQ
jgi:protein-S-isoprenylcysteine O-methyltransferase Ste14